MTRLGWDCPRCATTYIVPDLVCERCGTVAGQLRWILSLVERMGNASSFFGRRAPGRYPGPTEAQAAASTRCPACDGTGGERPVLISEWASCTRCTGTGHVWRDQLTAGERAADDVDRARRAAEARNRDVQQRRASEQSHVDRH